MPALDRTTLREASVVLAASIVLAFAYAGTMRKGLFAPPSAPQAEATNAAAATATFISYDEALAIHQSGNAVFIDARHAFDYTLGHIKGALNLPLNEFDKKKSLLDGIPKDKLIVMYCDGVECNSSIELAKKVTAAGFRNVKMFFGGWNEWQRHHAAVEQ